MSSSTTTVLFFFFWIFNYYLLYMPLSLCFSVSSFTIILCKLGFSFQDKPMDSDNVIVDDKYNIEAAEILANEAQVYPFDFWWGLFEFSIICLCVCVCLSLAFAYYRGGAFVRATSNTVSHRCEFLYHPSFCIIILISHFNYLSKKKKKKKIWSPNFNTWVIIGTEF